MYYYPYFTTDIKTKQIKQKALKLEGSLPKFPELGNFKSLLGLGLCDSGLPW